MKAGGANQYPNGGHHRRGDGGGLGADSPRPARVVGCVMVVGTFPVDKVAEYGGRSPPRPPS